MKEPLKPVPAADAKPERQKGGPPFFFQRLREKIYRLLGKGDFKEDLRRTMQAAAAPVSKDLPQWKPRGLITLSWLLGEAWRHKIPFAIVGGLVFWMAVTISPVQIAANFHRWLPGFSSWEALSSPQGRIWEKHDAQAKPLGTGLAAGAASLEGPGDASRRKNPAAEMSRTLIAMFSGSVSASPIAAAFLGDGTQSFASDGSPAFAGDDLVKGAMKRNAAAAVAAATAAAPRTLKPSWAQTSPDGSHGPIDEEMAQDMSGEISDLETRLSQYAKNETWNLEKAATHEETLPPLDGNAMKSSKSMQALWKIKKITEVAMHCAGDCGVETRLRKTRATFYGEKN